MVHGEGDRLPGGEAVVCPGVRCREGEGGKVKLIQALNGELEGIRISGRWEKSRGMRAAF